MMNLTVVGQTYGEMYIVLRTLVQKNGLKHLYFEFCRKIRIGKEK